MLAGQTLTTSTPLSRLPAGISPAAATRARGQAIDFESSFLNTMLQEMMADLPTNDLTGGGHAEEQWRGLLIDQYAKNIAQRGGIGVADTVYTELLRLQEQAR